MWLIAKIFPFLMIPAFSQVMSAQYPNIYSQTQRIERFFEILSKELENDPVLFKPRTRQLITLGAD
jgi:hypothetical protein